MFKRREYLMVTAVPEKFYQSWGHRFSTCMLQRDTGNGRNMARAIGRRAAIYEHTFATRRLRLPLRCNSKDTIPGPASGCSSDTAVASLHVQSELELRSCAHGPFQRTRPPLCGMLVEVRCYIDAHQLVGKRMTVIDYPDNRLRIEYEGRNLKYRSSTSSRRWTRPRSCPTSV